MFNQINSYVTGKNEMSSDLFIIKEKELQKFQRQGAVLKHGQTWTWILDKFHDRNNNFFFVMPMIV